MVHRKEEVTPIAAMLRGYDTILGTIRRELPDCEVYVESVLPLGGNYAELNSRVDQINAGLKKTAEKYKYPYVDVNSKFRGPDGTLAKELTTEGIHLTARGYDLWISL